MDIYTIIFVALAVFVCLRLYSVLGQSTESEPPFRVGDYQAAARERARQQEEEERQRAEAARKRQREQARQREQEEQQRRRNSSPGKLSRAQAFEIIGLKEGATEQQVRAAHSRLMKRVHPDVGGSEYFAKLLNAARDVLLIG